MKSMGKIFNYNCAKDFSIILTHHSIFFNNYNSSRKQMFWTKKKENTVSSVATDSITGFILGTGIVTAVNAASAKLMSAYGFTKMGILAKSMAAGLHSKFIIIKAGSWFATFQSFGALNFGILGPYFIPVAICVGLSFAVYPLIRRAFPSKIQEQPDLLAKIKYWWLSLKLYPSLIPFFISLWLSKQEEKPTKVSAKTSEEGSKSKIESIKDWWGKKEEKPTKVSAKKSEEGSKSKIESIKNWFGQKEEKPTKVSAKTSEEGSKSKIESIKDWWGKKQVNPLKVSTKTSEEGSTSAFGFVKNWWDRKEEKK